MKQRRFVLLDRDGTIIVDKHYLSDPDGVELLPGAVEGLCGMTALGLGLVVVTNQSGVGRGYLDPGQLEAIHRRLTELLAGRGVRLDGIWFCPHRPEEDCDCRKPRTGLVERAARELHFDPADAFVIGDKPADVELGRRLGATTFLVRTGYGAGAEAAGESGPDYVVDDLGEASRFIRALLGADDGD
jgi:D-glycero-D-manno-heptose 1,7-bisphosphate phosphatase